MWKIKFFKFDEKLICGILLYYTILKFQEYVYYSMYKVIKVCIKP